MLHCHHSNHHLLFAFKGCDKKTPGPGKMVPGSTKIYKSGGRVHKEYLRAVTCVCNVSFYKVIIHEGNSLQIFCVTEGKHQIFHKYRKP